ncbi:acyl-CoA dehydrogenase family protein [Cupriavidus metallidurans]|uniref:acyl-CoA dehydrogenase family protein n=1 Tax=Cupriavidus TaxID=106589 RepID=UPI000E96201D|nr:MULTISPECIES: acyl-CoA dehydrogenase family protein [unclassified Cupriavidus]GMG95080.1 acyl-CoA dehydrogenase [Cupriavidus sp. TKC]HBD39277.1 acyl-CoA dehydrogenase [Cupriavidus sp.]HBO82948.1 acyl-CoA dehydrogenase [Cupriavidus sp.]
MNFKLDDAQQMLQDSVRRYVDKDYSFEHRTVLLRTRSTCSEKDWATFAGNGWLAAALPEAEGGLGGSIVDTVLVAQELGRGLVVEPFLGCAVLAAQTLVAGATAAQREALLPGLADGSSKLALAYSEPESRGFPEIVSCRADLVDDGYVLHGVKSLVLGGVDADAFIVSACIADSADISLFLVDASSVGLSCQPLPLHDGTWAAEVTLEGVRVDAGNLLGQAGQGLAAMRHGLAHGTAALCAELVGGMERVIEISAEYLKVRKQFGVTIGSFQALQHRMADMAAELELSRSMLYHLLASIANDDADTVQRSVSQTKALIGRAARYVCGQAIQLHGGIGMTEEYTVGHYYKRAVVADALFGRADQHEAACAAELQATLN